MRRQLGSLLVVGVASVAVLLVGCGGGGSKSVQHRLVSPADFAAAVAEPGTVTLNVLGPGVPSIPGTDRAIPVNELSSRRSELPSASTQLAVYCARGHTSARAIPVLEQMGFTKIVELRGGMEAWAASGRTLLAPSG